MKAKLLQGLLAGAAFGAASLGFVDDAAAVQPIRQGTLTVAAERLTGLGLTFNNGNAEFGTGILIGSPLPMQFPRIGVDYFVIDGLSIGGTLGLSYYTAGEQFQAAVLPRVGYAFSLSQQIDFWPRGGIGFMGWDNGGGPFFPGGGGVSGVLFLEGTFVWNVLPNAGIEFGPTLDILLDSGTTTLAGNGGIVLKF